jgi:hypothetical protein
MGLHENSEHHNDKHNNPFKSYWLTELEKPFLEEPALKKKSQWLKPLTVFHALEFRGNY